MDPRRRKAYESLSENDKLLVKKKIDELLEEQLREEQEQERARKSKGILGDL